MTAMAKERTTASTDPTGSSLSPAEIQSLARETWAHMRQNSFERYMHAGKPGFKYKGNISRALGAVKKGTWRSLSESERDVLKNAMRQYLRYSGNAICINKERPTIEYWVSDSWSNSTPVPVGIPVNGTDRQEDWFQKKVTEAEITGGYDPFPVTTRRADGTIVPPLTHSPAFSDAKREELAEKVKDKVADSTPAKEPTGPTTKFKLDERWAAELIRLINVGDDSIMERTLQMAVTWDKPFTMQDFGDLYGVASTTPARFLATLLDAGLVTAEFMSVGDMRAKYQYSATADQKAAMQSVLVRKGEKVTSRNSYDTEQQILDALFVRKYQTPDQLAQKLFMGRSRLGSMLTKLAAAGKVERHHGGLGSGRLTSWRKVEQNTEKKVASPPPAAPVKTPAAPPTPPKVKETVVKTPSPNPAPSPGTVSTPKPAATPQNTALVPSATMQIARDVERLIERATEAIRAEERQRVDQVRKELQATREAKNAADVTIAELEEKVRQLEAWKSRFKKMMDDS